MGMHLNLDLSPWGLKGGQIGWFFIQFIMEITFVQVKDVEILGIIEQLYNISLSSILVLLSDHSFVQI